MNYYNEKLLDIIDVCEFERWEDASLYLGIGWKLLKVYISSDGENEVCWYCLGRPTDAPKSPQ